MFKAENRAEGGTAVEYQLKTFEMALAVTRIANIHYFEFTKQYHTFCDSHPFCELVYVDAGEISVAAEHYSGALLRNQAIIHRAGEVHSLQCGDSTAPNVIIIGFECDSAALAPFSYTPTELSAEQQRLLAEIIKEGRAVFLPPYDVPLVTDMKKRTEYPFGADQLIRLKLECFLIDLVRGLQIRDAKHTPPHTDAKIYEIHNYITENFRENITLEELCFLFNTNKTSLCRAFKAAYGDTVVNYINHLKIKEAKKLIRNDRLSMTEIADQVGFSSVHYFSRLFKQMENESPRTYMKTIKSKLENDGDRP